MMFGREFQDGGNIVNNGNFGNNRCFGDGGYAFMHHGLGMLIVIGVLIVIAILIFFLSRKNKKNTRNNTVIETLKMKYVQDEITEEEYLKRKAVLDKV